MFLLIFSNSGGPLFNLLEQAISINTAMDSGAENISFVILVNEVKYSINVKKMVE